MNNAAVHEPTVAIHHDVELYRHVGMKPPGVKDPNDAMDPLGVIVLVHEAATPRLFPN